MNTYRQNTSLLALSLTFAASLAGTASAQSSYAEIKPILDASCVSCHGPRTARKGVRFDTEVDAVKFSAAGAAELRAGSMPPRRPAFAPSAEGQTLLDWFSAQAK